MLILFSVDSKLLTELHFENCFGQEKRDKIGKLIIQRIIYWWE
jgi:hypothetical protein